MPNLAAFTSLGINYPEYVSINTDDSGLNADDSGLISITVRSPKKQDGACGETACIRMTAAEFNELLDSIGCTIHIPAGYAPCTRRRNHDGPCAHPALVAEQPSRSQ